MFQVETFDSRIEGLYLVTLVLVLFTVNAIWKMCSCQKTLFICCPPHVRYPKEKHGQVFRKHCPKAAASEAFEWAVILVSVVLVRAIKARSGEME